MDGGSQPKFEELRRRAERLLKDQGEKEARFSGEDTLSLIHELEVHEIELRLQNEELRHAHRELEVSKKAYADLYDLAPVGYVTTGSEGTVVSVNRAAQTMLGRPKKNLLDRGFSSFVHPQDHNAYFALLQKSVRRAWAADSPSGPGGSPSPAPGDSAGGRAGNPSRRPRGEIRLLRAGSGPFYARVEIAPAPCEKGAFAGWLIVFSDISEQKAAEEELKNYAEKLEHSNRELQEFAFIASHDLQEPLRKIQAFGQMLSKKFAPTLGEEGLDYVERMCRASGRLQDMVRGLLDYSRVLTEGKSFASVDLGRIVNGVLSDLEWQIKKSAAEVRVENLPVVQADANQMRRLFQNLISNALKFYGRHRPVVRIYSSTEDEPGSRRHRLFVEDNGIGFDQEHAERIFSLFERLHGRSLYEGSGIGLAVCRRIVERHGGTITATGRPGRGATFAITLPA